MSVEPLYPFATDPRPTTGAATYDSLSLALGRARAISARATARHCANPSPISLAIARAAARAVIVCSDRWVRHAYDRTGNHSSEQVLP